MEEIPDLILLGKNVEKLKGFTTTYLIIISAMLTNVILNRTYDFYHDKQVVLTLSDVIDFMLSPQGALFITVCALIAGSHYVIVPIFIKAMSYIAWGFFLSGGNLFFYSIYFILTKIFRLKAEKRFSFIGEKELLNYILYLVRVCHYQEGRTVRNKYFGYYKWYVTNIVDPLRRTPYNVYLTTAILISTWVVIHQYKIFELAPLIYYIITCVLLCYMANAIIVSWVVNKKDYFLEIVTTSISYVDSLELQRNPRV